MPQPARAQANTNPDAEIIFIDANGFIRVLDTNRTKNNPLVEWVSPTGNWTDFAVGDVNNDGDAEIIAIGGDATTGKLAVYDPVVAAGPIDLRNVINGIPWTTLYETTIPGKPTLVGAGRLNPNKPNAGIVYGYALNSATRVHPDDSFRLVFLQTANTPPDGRQWQPQIAPYDFVPTWTQMVVGSADDHPGDDLILIGAKGKTSILSIYRIEQSLVRLYNNESNDRVWHSAALGQFKPDTENQVAIARDGQINWDSLFVMRYNSKRMGNFEDIYSEFLSPPPLNLFFANVNGSADQELFMLRSVPNTLPTTVPHFFVRNRGKDPALQFDLRLDGDNGYQVGAGGDLDGDGKDEVVILRNDRIRIYPNIALALNFAEYSFATNCPVPGTTPGVGNSGRCSLKIADVDSRGFVHIPKLTLTPNPVTVAVAAGLQADPVPVQLTNSNTDDAIAFSAALEGSPAWVTLSAMSGQTPATLTLNFDARSLIPGQYTTKLNIASTNPNFINATISLDLVLNVQLGLSAQPAVTLATVYPCLPPPTQFTQTVAFDGPTGHPFTALKLLAGPIGTNSETIVPWFVDNKLSSTTLPSTVSFILDPSKLTSSYEQAHLHAETTDDENHPISRDFPFDLFCASDRIYLPLIAR